MRFAIPLFLCTLIGTGVLGADPITWGTLMVDDIVNFGAGATTTGFSFDGGCVAAGFNCAVDGTVQDEYTVNESGDYIESFSVNINAQSFNCSPQLCFPYAQVTVYQNGNELGGGYTPGTDFVDGLGSATYGTGYSDSEIMYLAAGTYTVIQDYAYSAHGTGDTNLTAFGQFSIVPTPEPRTPWLPGAGLVLLIMYCRFLHRARRRSL